MKSILNGGTPNTPLRACAADKTERNYNLAVDDNKRADPEPFQFM